MQRSPRPSLGTPGLMLWLLVGLGLGLAGQVALKALRQPVPEAAHGGGHDSR